MVNVQKIKAFKYILTGLGLLFFFIIYLEQNKHQAAAILKPSGDLIRPKTVSQRDLTPVFPGAEGYGTQTPAGRGGKLIEVTSLADSGAGTLRAALEYPNPRMIVFRVGGIIELKSHLFINSPFVTVAGQTAPGDGILIKDFGIVITTNDVLIQHIRIRPGNTGRVKPEDNDAIAILGKHDNVTGAYNIVLDHISASWGEDETISTWFGPHDITISWSIISEALSKSRHSKKGHGAGILIGNNTDHVSIHHNLLAHNDFRNPLIINGGTHQFVNNVVYDWGVEATHISDYSSNSFINIVGNKYIAGPSTSSSAKVIQISSSTKDDKYGRTTPKIFLNGNIGPNSSSVTEDISELFKFSVDPAFIKGNTRQEKINWAKQTYFADKPFTPSLVNIFTAQDSYEKVLAGAGAVKPVRDAVDSRIIREVITHSGKIIDSPSETGGYPVYRSGTPPSDTDHDGMPDNWEIKNGLDPDNPSDGSGDHDMDGYTNIEEYLHSVLK